MDRISLFMSNTGASHRWSLWVLTTTMLAFQNLEFFTIGALSASIEKSLSIDPSQTGMLLGAYSLAYGIMQFPAGLAFARFRPIRLLIIACVIFAVGNLIFAWAPSLAVATVGRFISGIGGSFFFLGYYTISATRFESIQFARLLGYNQMAKYLLLVIVLAAIPAMLDVISWRVYFTLLSGFFLFFIIPLIAFDRMLKSEPAPKNKETVRKDLVGVFSNRQLLYVLLVGMLGAGGIVAFTGLWYLPFAQRVGYTHTNADWINSAMILGLAIGSAGFGWISDRLKKRKALMVVGLIATLIPMCIVIAWKPPSSTLEVTLAVFIAIASTAYYPIIYTLAKESASARLAPTVGGVLNTAIFLGVAIMQFAPGFIISLLGGKVADPQAAPIDDFRWALLVFPIGLMVSLMASLRLKETAGIQPE